MFTISHYLLQMLHNLQTEELTRFRIMTTVESHIVHTPEEIAI